MAYNFDISDPHTEVWICQCGQPLSERGVCAECAREEAHIIQAPPIFLVIGFLMMVGMLFAVGLVISAAWCFYRTFGW